MKLRITAVECDWKECFDADQINYALHEIGKGAVFYNVSTTESVDSNVLLIANQTLTNEQVALLFNDGDLYLCDRVFEAWTFDRLRVVIQDYVTERYADEQG